MFLAEITTAENMAQNMVLQQAGVTGGKARADYEKAFDKVIGQKLMKNLQISEWIPGIYITIEQYFFG